MMPRADRYGVMEVVLESEREYGHPLWDCELEADINGPSGQCLTVCGFWDGGRIWRLRFSPDEPGVWHWRTRCTVDGDTGLNDRQGAVRCDPRGRGNPVYDHGPLTVSPTGRFLEHEDGTPFFWLGDTAWNGVIRGDDTNWDRYLTTRRSQCFTVIQFVCSHWRGDALDECGEAACDENSPIQINPRFFQRLDRRVAMVNEAGLVAAPVILWSLLETDIGYKLPTEEAIRLAGYIVARYDAYQVAWLLGGDGNYHKMGIDRWKTIGRAVFRAGCGHRRPVTLHPCGQSWVGDAFRTEEWYDFIGYQSGHGDSREHIEWLVRGEPASAWDRSPIKPVINLEPNYETAIGYQHRTHFTDYHVRRAAYWSLLVSPPAGVTYGHDAVWNWNFETGPSEGHGNWHDGEVPAWYTGLETDGTHSMTVLRQLFATLDWTTLRPAHELLAEQPGGKDPACFVACARSHAGTVVAYSPCNTHIHVTRETQRLDPCRLIDPRTGDVQRIAEWTTDVITLPDDRDWVLVIG